MGALPIVGVVRHRLSLLQHFWALERRGNRGLPNLRLMSRGFLSNRAWLYPLDRFDAHLFLTDLEAEARLPRLNSTEAMALLGDKLRFHEWVRSGSFPGTCPELIGLVEDGRATTLDGSPLPRADVEGRAMISKPVDGSGGRGVRRISSVDEVDRRGRFLLEAAVVQHPYASAIYPHAVNTIRVLVGHDEASGKTILLGAAHRFGTERSRPTDNFKAGGIVSLIELESGTLSDAISDDGGPSRTTLPRHPETGTRIGGTMIPHWNDIKTLARACTRSIAGLVYVGWDIALTEDGPIVIEGNGTLANPNLIQFHEPMLLRQEVRDFFAAKGAISPNRLERIRASQRHRSFKAD
ncbi:hypothetical protein LAC81_32395 [Ensifer adhaerens]|uniref:sugar-transfer associated ATP-grasp domain-containing protein n=1 Tax=Ensifer adhaerens TaxID=106592 RepID=UPI001CC160FD|nr:sugar-transfer associated ATP-grasp domain-containing protein [Ensifer adhaerens]MBZ7925442.1 hypothetical protein [Ensifer adhaerens]UAX95398.1 hypothetical protein LAC78_31435 [Ensifer adhaerens]UAY02710.1 hypothetical protein LAC80_28875 [Ensifer adhaerens]UAY10694.1 hypothetical protein LAC81_32395 [Ensifer adhaerens]